MKLQTEIRSFDQARAHWRAHVKPGTRAVKLGANLLLVCLDFGYRTDRGDHAFAVRLYETDILRFYSDGTFSVDNGGWNTPTTIRILNAFAPAGWTFQHVARKLHARFRRTPTSHGHAVATTPTMRLRVDGGAS